MKTPMLIATGLHILNPAFHRALEERNSDLLLELAADRIDRGAQGLDINPGPARRFHARLPWVVETIQRKFSIPLLLPTGPALADSLRAHQGQPFINAVTGDPAQLDQGITLAREHGANLVVLLTRPGCLHTTSEDRLRVAMAALDQAAAQGLPPENLFLDPVLSLRPDPRSWSLGGGMPDLEPVLETMALIRELSQGQCRTMLALAPTGPGLSRQRRRQVRQRVLILLVRAGLDAVLLDTRDQELVRTARHPHCGDTEKKAA